MTIAILKLEAGQQIARPFRRACDLGELLELVGRHIATIEAASQGMSLMGQIRYAEANWDKFTDDVLIQNVDSERPVASLDGVVFYAFREE